MTTMHLPNDPTSHGASLARMSMEREAMQRAERWVKVDPFYEGKPMTERERALMRLALRAYTHPTDTEILLIKMETRTDGTVE